MGIIDRKLLWLALSGTGAANLSGADALLDGEAQGLAFDFTDQSVRIIDTSTPSNSTRSTGIVNQGSLVGPSGKLVYTSASNKITLQSDGVMRYQAHNMLVQSEDISTTWIAAAATAADAETLASDGNANAHFVRQTFNSVAGASYNLSVEFKAETADYSWLSLYDGTTYFGAVFNLSTGAVAGTRSGSTNLTSSSIEALPDGWYRCSILGVASATNAQADGIQVGLSLDGTLDVTDAGGAGQIKVRKAHLYRYPANTDYIRTTSAAKYALPLEYSATDGSCLGLLVEEQRINILLQSQDAATTWGATQLTVTANDTTAPTGETTGDRLTEAATTNFHFIAQSGLSITASTNYTMSVFVKDGTRRYVQLAFDDASNGPHATYDLTSVAVTETGSHGSGGSYVSSSITAVGNGWYRLSLTGTVGGSTGDRALILLAPSATPGWAPSYAGNTGNYLYVWGMQLEAGSFPTSPILTYGAASTRNADPLSQLSTTFPLSATAGSLYAYVAPYAGADLAGIVSLNDGSGNEEIVIYKDASANIVAQVEDGGVGQLAPLDSTVNASSGTAFKVELAWAADDFALSADGTAAQTDTGGTLPTVTTLEIGVDQANNYFNGHIKAISYVPRRKTDAELQTETA